MMKLRRRRGQGDGVAKRLICLFLKGGGGDVNVSIYSNINYLSVNKRGASERREVK